MKKTLLTIVTLVTIGFTNAQIKGKGAIEITPKIGYSSFSEYNDEDSTDSNSGVEFGATADYYFNNRWSLRSGLSFDKMGGTYTYNENVFDEPTEYEDVFNYLNIPINANWHFGSTRKWNLNFGLTPSFLLDSKIKENGVSYDFSSEYLKSFQLGVSYGIGYKIEVNKKFGILIDAQFFNGLTNISSYSYYTIQNSGYSFNIGGVFQL